ncbi:hypothetical protein NDU88_005217 [Pleurodeles waltl]|uniref:Uncharacterized protein n=1 Tax=Pleurodeles waltl TaxID=8319 RepID=A0AAV7SL20_PLEWA|nr:hypothetical protein NDU88_005217 [Pleurodeles waltl]
MIIQAVDVSRKALELKIDTIAADLSILQDDHRRLSDKDTTTERALDAITPDFRQLHTPMTKMESLEA